ncbi:precorrin-2 dehydrogenase/sirohydrochlorin ferrochelatase family protein [Salibacterium salarium]|uniref:precorrin-2 dehydrogenase/sirohydrochlorin ferrochelatase family protein n=1 Tax=Salibacterium salarium TaxID=284579 RepID=UPI0027D89EB1|nr:bifunctional precorrin-2 dehydrogenase/sirohydrochlorin ferrochelatase [Salibacterium salarium]
MFNFPLFIHMEGKSAVVVGGGKIACRKVNKLLDAGAKITVIAPELHDDLMCHYLKENIHWIKDVCKADYLTSAFIIISASGNKEAQDIIRQSSSPYQLVNGADNQKLGNVAFPASFQEDMFHVAVSTNGASPAKAKSIKQKLKKWFKEKKYKN